MVKCIWWAVGYILRKEDVILGLTALAGKTVEEMILADHHQCVTTRRYVFWYRHPKGTVPIKTRPINKYNSRSTTGNKNSHDIQKDKACECELCNYDIPVQFFCCLFSY